MVVVALVLFALIAIAATSAVRVYRRAASAAWSAEFDKGGVGLSRELSFLALATFVAVAVSMIMSDAFTTLYLDGAWRSGWYLGFSLFVVAGVALYMFHIAPSNLADTQEVAPKQQRSECQMPYRIYAPYPMVLWVGLVLPVVALLVVSIYTDSGAMSDARRDLSRNGAQVLALADRGDDAAPQHLALYALEYRAAVDTAKRTVNRYLWVIGVFVVFLLIVLNTRIASAYAETAQDAIKGMMWFFLLVAVVVCAIGILQFRAMRELAITTHEQTLATASMRGELDGVVAAKEALLDVREAGPAQFAGNAILGVFGLFFFAQMLEVVLAKVTNRSAIDMIFPSRVARLFNQAWLEPKEPARKR